MTKALVPHLNQRLYTGRRRGPPLKLSSCVVNKAGKPLWAEQMQHWIRPCFTDRRTYRCCKAVKSTQGLSLSVVNNIFSFSTARTPCWISLSAFTWISSSHLAFVRLFGTPRVWLKVIELSSFFVLISYVTERDLGRKGILRMRLFFFFLINAKAIHERDYESHMKGERKRQQEALGSYFL